MIRTVLAIVSAVAVAVSGMSVVASKRLSYESPDGHNSMWLERSSAADLDSSATGYVYNNDGLGPATLLHLSSLPAYEKINHGFEGVGYPYQQAFSSAEGSQGIGSYFANSGEKGDKGYNGFDAFQKGLAKKYNKNQDSGFYKDAAGHKKGHHDEGAHYGGFEVASKGEQGGKFGEENSHKKGSKTTGFHKVYHKDEFKKEHSFYDESDKKGHASKYGKGDSSFGAEKGSFQKGGHEDSGFHEGGHGKNGFYNKGASEEQAEGYKGGAGENSHHHDGAEYGNSGGSNFHKHFGYGDDHAY